MEPRTEHISKALERWTPPLLGDANPGGEAAVPTGIGPLDERVGGLPRGGLTVLGGMPGMGKTALAVNIAVRAALEHSVKTAYLALDGGAYGIVQNMLCLRAGVCLSRARRRRFGQGERARLAEAAEEFKAAPLFLGDCMGLSLEDLVLEMDLIYDYADPARHDQLQLVFVDSLSGVSVDANGVDRHREVEYVARMLRERAETNEVAYVLLAQTGDYAEEWDARQPKPADLRHFRALARHASAIMLVHRHAYFDPKGDPGRAELIVAHNRVGPTLSVPLWFDRATLRFEGESIGGRPC